MAELDDQDAARTAQWCDRCMSYHAGPVGVYACTADDGDDFDDSDLDTGD